jgi:hypothetical protein
MTNFDDELAELRDDFVVPDAAAKRRVSTRLSQSIAAAGVLGFGTVLARQGLAWAKPLKIMASFLLGSAIAVGVDSALNPAPVEPAAKVQPPARVHAPAHSAASTALAPEDVPTEAAPAEAPASPRSVRLAPTLPTPSSVSNRAASLGEQQALLDVARSSFAHGDYAQTLRTLAAHFERFPSSMLGEEREALQIKALAASQRSSEARARAAAFRTQYPQSLMLPSIEKSLSTNP